MYYSVVLVSKDKTETIIVEAINKREASHKAKIGKEGFIAVSATERSVLTSSIVGGIYKWFEGITRGRISIDQKISTVSQIAVMSDAGIPIHQTLEDVAHSVENKRLKEIYSNVAMDINSGKSMSEAMSRYSSELGDVVLAMTKLGESTGNISGAYSKLTTILEDIRDNISKFKKAIRSPIITLIAMVIAFIVLIIYVVPTFSDIFAKLGSELPLATRILLWMQRILSNYGIYILVGIVLVIYIAKRSYEKSQDFKYGVDRLLVHPKFYLVNKVIFLSNMQRYMLVFSELVKAGIPVADALDTAVDMVDNIYIKKKLLSVNSNISRGMGLGDAFGQTKLFENMLLQMIRAGESSGELERMLGKVRDYYSMKFEEIIDNMTTYIEPIMLLLIASLVLLMALGVFMPMWDLGRVVN